VTTTRLMTGSPQLLRSLFPGTVAAAVAAGLTVSTMVLRENGDGWQLFAVLLVLALLGEMLTPILQRVANAPAGEAPSERILGEIAGAVVVAARGRQRKRSVLLGNREVPLADDERIVIRPSRRRFVALRGKGRHTRPVHQFFTKGRVRKRDQTTTCGPVPAARCCRRYG